MRPNRAQGLLVTLGLSLTPTSFAVETQAQQGTAAVEPAGARVVLVTNHAGATIMPLLRSELERLGLTIVVVDRVPNEVLPRDLSKAARAKNAIAGFRVIVARGTVEVWIADRVTGKVILREVLLQPSASKADESVVVLRAIELLRVSLMELEAPHPPRGEVAPPPQLDALVGFPESSRQYALDLGVGAAWLSDAFPLFPVLALGVNMRVAPAFSMGMGVSLPLGNGKLDTDIGEAAVTPRKLSTLVRWQPAGPTSVVEPSVGLGGGALWLDMEGKGNDSRPGFSRNSVSPVLLVDSDLTLRLSDNLGVSLAIYGGYVTRKVSMVFENEEVGSFSQVMGGARAGMRFAWP